MFLFQINAPGAVKEREMIVMQAPFLAQYSIRSKQAYIFRTNRLAEITGGSKLIANAFQVLYECANQLALAAERAVGGPDFDRERILGLFEAGDLDLVELFEGGGNDTVLFRDRSVFVRLNRAYTKYLLENCPGMIPMCVGVETEGLLDYDADYRRLMRAAEREKNRMLSGGVPTAQPFAMTDRSTFQPLSRVWLEAGQEWRRSDEAYAKLKAGQQSDRINHETRLLDDMTTRHGEESLLAIVHADGNNMGIKIQQKLHGHTDYDFCVKAMRDFTREIREVFSVRGKKAVDAKAAELKRTQELRNSAYSLRWIVYDGDDATFICNARLAKELTQAYLQAVAEDGEAYSACAGICIFHSHYPVARAYSLAEQACDSAKEPIHSAAVQALRKKRPVPEEGWMDFHYIRSGVGDDLDEIRDRHGVAKIIARPWLVCGPSGDQNRSVEKLDQLAEALTAAKFNRANLKTFGAAYEEDPSLGKLEWERATRMLEGTELPKLDTIFPTEDQRFHALYDLSEIYDLWYQTPDPKADEEG